MKDDKEKVKEVSFTRVLNHIAFDGAESIKGSVVGTAESIEDKTASTAETLKDVTVKTVTFVPGVISGIFGALLPDVIPDVKNIDKLVQTTHIAAYSFIGFSLTGTLLFSMRIIREFGQWRQWYRYRKLMKNKMKDIGKPVN